MVARSIDPDTAPIGPPVLLPASIIRQVLFDATELTPVWARPRPGPESVAAPAEAAALAAPKRTRRSSTGGATKASKPVKPKATPRRTRASDRPANESG